MCPVCGEYPPEIGVLCQECVEELCGPIAIAPEQIEMRSTRATDAALVDHWGRVHRLDALTVIGRDVDHGLAIVEGSVSRQHARISEGNDAWIVHDLGSANGTFVDDRLLAQHTELRSGQRVRFGYIGFFFLNDASSVPAPRPSRTISQTMRPADVVHAAARTLELETPRVATLPTMTISLQAPTGGGGGVVEIEGKQVQLTVPQYEFVGVMLARTVAEEDQHEHVRGFISSAELVAQLSLDSAQASEDNIRQLVRRVRRALIKAEIGDVIESRQGLGYRLRFVPRAK